MIEQFYADVNKAVKQAKNDDVVIVLGDFNAKVGDQNFGTVVGTHKS